MMYVMVLNARTELNQKQPEPNQVSQENELAHSYALKAFDGALAYWAQVLPVLLVVNRNSASPVPANKTQAAHKEGRVLRVITITKHCLVCHTMYLLSQV